MKTNLLKKIVIFLFVGAFIVHLQVGSNKVDKEVSEKTPTSFPEFQTAKVTNVFDGDTIEIEGGQKVRYIGVDTPEIYPARECFSQEARNENSRMVAGKTVRLQKDISDLDKYGRLLRFVYVDDVFVNKELVKNGFAIKQSVPSDLKNSEDFNLLQENAKSLKLGLWGKCF